MKRKAIGSNCRVVSCLSLLLLGLHGSACEEVSAATQSNGSPYYSFKNLEKVLNQQVDQPSDWRQEYRQIAPPARTIPGPQGESRYSFKNPNVVDRSFHTFFPWRGSQASPPSDPGYQGYAVSGSAGTSGAATPQSNPFNLSPFGILHYLWDPTTYTSSSNPVSLVEVRSDLQVAQQQSALAESAARRAKYASNPQERQEAAAQAKAYAVAARAAAQRAQEVAQAGSSNPAEVAALATQEADRAVSAARQATTNLNVGSW